MDKLFLVAPWLDPEQTLTTGFFTFQFDDRLARRTGEFHVFHSSDDRASIRTSVAILLERYSDAIEHRYDHMGHFCREDMGTDRFPDLLRTIDGG